MSSLAQEESRSISENVAWGQRKRMADGKVSLPYKRFLGYEKGADGLPKIVEEEAKTVRLIYRLFMQGRTAGAIARQLVERGIPTPAGKKNWQANTVESILANEKYKGDAVLQKTFTVDFLTKKAKINQGELPQYYVERSHEPIIDPAEFNMAQAERARRKRLKGRYYGGGSIFTSKIACGCCGGLYGSKVWHSTSKYRRSVWQCNDKFKNRQKCPAPHLGEENIKAHFLAAFNKPINNREEIAANCRLAQEGLGGCADIEAQIEEARRKQAAESGLAKEILGQNARAALDAADYAGQYGGCLLHYETLAARIKELESLRLEWQRKYGAVGEFIRLLEKRGQLLSEFDESLWLEFVERMTVFSEIKIIFTFKGGTQVQV
jgi:hypothetical protein